MASTTLSSKISKYCLVDIELLGNVYKKFKLTVMEDLCGKVILVLIEFYCYLSEDSRGEAFTLQANGE